MRKFICVAVAAVLCLTMFSACGKKDDKKNSGTSSNVSAVATIEPTATPAPQMAKIVVIKGADSGLNVRSGASTDAESLGMVENGEKFRLLVAEEQDGWYQIQYGARNAYVYAEYVSVEEVTLEEANKLGTAGNTGSSDDTSSTSEVTSTTSDTSTDDGEATSVPYSKENEDGES